MISFIVLLFGIAIVYRTYSLFLEKQNIDIETGQIKSQGHDAMISFVVEDGDGNKTTSTTMPEGTNWKVSLECDNGASGYWDWGPRIVNLST